jgi:hypothetical protein
MHCKEVGSVWFQIGYIGKKSDWQAHSRDLTGAQEAPAMGFEQAP